MTKYQDIAMMLEANAITNTVDAYNKGRADKYKEITSDYMLLTEKQVEEIRVGAIEECKQILLDAMARDGKTKCHEYMVAINEMERLKQ